jgi:hypothetical protein
MPVEQMDTEWIPSTEIEKAAIVEQLERLLLDPYFSHSIRYPTFLRFVVTHFLEGRVECLKERTLGIEVFGRTPDYDTTVDPIVRVTAAEIRKRILKYYKDPLHEDEVRILLPTGSYAPHFELPEAGATRMALMAHSPYTGIAPPIDSAFPDSPINSLPSPTTISFSDIPTSQKRHTHRTFLTVSLLAAAMALLLIAGGFALRRSHSSSPVEAFWGPLLGSSKPVLICVADQSRYAAISLLDASDPVRGSTVTDHSTTLDLDDAVPLVDFATMIRSHGVAYTVQGQGKTTFTDLGHGPTVLIGAFDNSWTLRLTNSLRFHFANDPEMTQVRIEDRQAPTKRDWVSNLPEGEQGSRKDYALVARFIDPNTGQATIVAAGLGHNGTAAAGEFLLSPQSLSDFDRIAPKKWRRENIEVVLETMVVNGHAGPPHIDAIHTW